MLYSTLLCQVVWFGKRVFGPGVEAAVEDIGQVAFERAAGFSGGLAFCAFALEVDAGVGVHAGLDDGDAVQGGVHLAVSAAVQAVALGGLAGAAGDGRDTAEAREGAGLRKRRTAPAGGMTAAAPAGAAPGGAGRGVPGPSGTPTRG